MDNKNNTNPKDAFSDLIRQKLENHQIPVDPNSWSKLEERMQPKRKKIFLWWMVIGSAAVLALIFSIIPFGADNMHHEYALETVTEIEVDSANTENEPIIKPDSDKNQETNSIDSKRLTKNPEVKVAKGNITLKTSTKNVLVAEGKDNTFIENKSENSNSNAKVTEVVIPDKESTEEKESNKKIQKIDELPEIENFETPDIQPKNKNDKWLVAAAFGSGGSTSIGGNYDMLMETSENKMLAAAETRYTSILSPDDFSQKTFMAPLSFGIVVRRNLGSKIAVETGLVYTYLYSTFEENGNPQYDAQLKLHYLGVPVNLVVPLWKNKQWETYISAGPMLEKGIRSMYVQHQYFGNQIMTTKANTKIDGWQWSVNTAVGITFNMYSDIGFYVEPKFSYFFDNNQPLSARTDQPVVLGLTAGIRFKF